MQIQAVQTGDRKNRRHFPHTFKEACETCEFENIDNKIKSQIIQSCSSIILWRKAHREREIHLKQLLLLARLFEISDEQATGIENDAAHVNAMRNPTARKQKPQTKST